MHSTLRLMAPPPEKVSAMVPEGASSGVKEIERSDRIASSAPWRMRCDFA